MTDGEQKDVNQGSSKVWHQGNEQDKLPKLPRTPGAFKIFSAIEKGRSSNQDGDDVLLRVGRGEVDPWSEKSPLRNEGEVVLTT